MRVGRELKSKNVKATGCKLYALSETENSCLLNHGLASGARIRTKMQFSKFADLHICKATGSKFYALSETENSCLFSHGQANETRIRTKMQFSKFADLHICKESEDGKAIGCKL